MQGDETAGFGIEARAVSGSDPALGCDVTNQVAARHGCDAHSVFADSASAR
jgi:hypothetical protein